MERLKAIVPPDLVAEIADSTAESLPVTCSRLLDCVRDLPQFHEIVAELTDKRQAMCCKDGRRALELKVQGNEFFAKGDFQKAVALYTKALRYAPTGVDADVILVATIFVNRASSMHKLNHLEQSLRDCNRAITRLPNYSKAWYRRGLVNSSLENYDIAVRDLKVALSLEGTSSGKNNINRMIQMVLDKLTGTDAVVIKKNEDVPSPAERCDFSLKSFFINGKGRGMVSSDDIPPGSLLHVEDPLAAIVLKPYGETHCHYCFNEAPVDVLFCSSCILPIYCSEQCQEQAGGEICHNDNVYPELKSIPLDIQKHVMNVISRSSAKQSKFKHADHKHECGGVHWAAVLPSDVVLVGRLMARSIEKATYCGESYTESLDLVHHYDLFQSSFKIEAHVYALVLLYCLHSFYGSKFPCSGESVAELVHLLFMVKINSIAVVHVRSMMDGATKFSEYDDAPITPTQQISVGQAIYSSGSLFNHSCQPNVHAYFVSRSLYVRSTEFILAGSPIEMSYGPQVGQMDLVERQKELEERYFFQCSCLGCSQLNLSDLVIDSFRCTRSGCLGVVTKWSYCKYHSHNSVLAKISSHSNKLLLRFNEDEEVVAHMLYKKCDDIDIGAGYCLRCGMQLDLSLVIPSSVDAMERIHRLQRLQDDSGRFTKSLVPKALETLKAVRSVWHCYSRAVAQAEDFTAEAFAQTRDWANALEHCEESIKVLEKLYKPNHIVLGHELIKLATIQLSLGDTASAFSSITRSEHIFSLYYGSHFTRLLPFIGKIREQACYLASTASS